MARTLRLNMTGRAAATDRAEMQENKIGQLVDMSALRARLKQKEEQAIARCIALEDRKSFYAWYMKVDGSISARVEAIEERIAILEGEKLYTVVDNLLGEEGAHPFQIMDAAEAMGRSADAACRHDFRNGTCPWCGEKLEEFPY